MQAMCCPIQYNSVGPILGLKNKENKTPSCKALPCPIQDLLRNFKRYFDALADFTDSDLSSDDSVAELDPSLSKEIGDGQNAYSHQQQG